MFFGSYRLFWPRINSGKLPHEGQRAAINKNHMQTMKMLPEMFKVTRRIAGLTGVGAAMMAATTFGNSLDSYAPIDLIGRGIAQTVNDEIKAEITKLGRDNLFLITGTLKPSSSVTDKAGSLKTVSARGRTGRGAEALATFAAESLAGGIVVLAAGASHARAPRRSG